MGFYIDFASFTLINLSRLIFRKLWRKNKHVITIKLFYIFLPILPKQILVKRFNVTI